MVDGIISIEYPHTRGILVLKSGGQLLLRTGGAMGACMKEVAKEPASVCLFRYYNPNLPASLWKRR